MTCSPRLEYLSLEMDILDITPAVSLLLPCNGRLPAPRLIALDIRLQGPTHRYHFARSDFREAIRKVIQSRSNVPNVTPLRRMGIGNWLAQGHDTWLLDRVPEFNLL